jgi:hypothetical protein
MDWEKAAKEEKERLREAAEEEERGFYERRAKSEQRQRRETSGAGSYEWLVPAVIAIFAIGWGALTVLVWEKGEDLFFGDKSGDSPFWDDIEASLLKGEQLVQHGLCVTNTTGEWTFCGEPATYRCRIDSVDNATPTGASRSLSTSATYCSKHFDPDWVSEKEADTRRMYSQPNFRNAGVRLLSVRATVERIR